MSRTIVKTTTVGWYIDASDPDGPRVRKKDGDTVVTREEFATSRATSGNFSTNQQPTVSVPVAHNGESKPEQTEAEKAIPTTTSETGKILRGKTTTIKCGFKGEDGESGPVCGKERTIKVQDVFQVKYCVEHQVAHRRKIKRDKLKAKRQAAKTAAAK